MKKSDLKQNMIVETRDGDRYLVLENVEANYGHQDLLFMASDEFEIGSDYTEDLLDKDNESNYDIIKVMKWKEFKGLKYLSTAKINEFEVLWKRPATIDWQPWELEVLKNIPPYFKEISKYHNVDIHIRQNLLNHSYILRLNLPSLPAYKITDNVWFDIDEELARYGMKREIEQ